jgi:hypothetical protein
MSEHSPLHKPRIEIAPGVFVVPDKRAGQGWIQAWGVFNAALKRCQTNQPGETQDDHDNDQHP